MPRPDPTSHAAQQLDPAHVRATGLFGTALLLWAQATSIPAGGSSIARVTLKRLGSVQPGTNTPGLATRTDLHDIRAIGNQRG